MNQNGKIKQICIDLDRYTTKKKFKKIVSFSEERCLKFGDIIHSKPTKHGHHIKIKLTRQVSFWRSIEIRYYCCDDIKRMFYDIMRYRKGGKMIDTCFDIKKYLNKDGITKDHGKSKN